MRLFGIKCEVCCHKHMQSGDMWKHDRRIPNGWLLVFNGDPQETEPYHFCSVECLHAWTERSMKSNPASKSFDPDVILAEQIKVKTALL